MKIPETISFVAAVLASSQKPISLVVLAVIVAGAANAATVAVTVDDGVSNIGAQGTFYWAITNAHAGDTISFNIPGAGPHYLKEPPGGFPLVIRSQFAD